MRDAINTGYLHRQLVSHKYGTKRTRLHNRKSGAGMNVYLFNLGIGQFLCLVSTRTGLTSDLTNVGLPVLSG